MSCLQSCQLPLPCIKLWKRQSLKIILLMYVTFLTVMSYCTSKTKSKNYYFISHSKNLSFKCFQSHNQWITKLYLPHFLLLYCHPTKKACKRKRNHKYLKPIEMKIVFYLNLGYLQPTSIFYIASPVLHCLSYI